MTTTQGAPGIMTELTDGDLEILIDWSEVRPATMASAYRAMVHALQAGEATYALCAEYVCVRMRHSMSASEARLLRLMRDRAPKASLLDAF